MLLLPIWSCVAASLHFTVFMCDVDLTFHVYTSAMCDSNWRAWVESQLEDVQKYAILRIHFALIWE